MVVLRWPLRLPVTRLPAPWMRPSSRRRRAIEQALLALGAVATKPLRDRAHAHAGGFGCRRERPTLRLDPFHHQQATMRTGAGVTVQLHPGPPWDWWL